MKKIIAVCFSLLLVCSAFCARVGATEADKLPEEYYEMVEQLPDDLLDKLPDGIASEDTESIGDTIMSLTSSEYVFSLIGELFGEGLGGAVGLAARLCGILVISAVFSSFKRSIGSDAVSGAIGFCSSCAVFAAIIEVEHKQILMVGEFFERLNSLMLSMIPVTGAVYAMCGNVTTAATGSATMYAFLAVSEGICAKTIVPISSICLALALCRSVSPDLNLQGISSGIKKCYTFVLGMIMTILIALLSAQTSLSAAADSTAARAAKMVASTVIPVVGGSVSETLRTVASSVQYMKSIVGVGGIAFVLILLLPTLVTLLLNRLAFMAAGCIADLLGCESESRLISDIGAINGCMIATVSMCSVMFILALNIFIKTAVAIL